MKTAEDIRRMYEETVCLYVTMFNEKHRFEEYDPTMWVAGEIGGIICIGDMFVNFEDIRYDIDKDITDDVFCEWYWNSMECHEIGLDYPNYKNYCKGAPTPEQETIDRVKELRKELMRLTQKPLF